MFLAAHLDLRAVWIPRWSISDGNEIFSYLGGEFNHVFLQVFALGEAYYPSQYAPSKNRSDLWLTSFINEAHKRNIKVSAWMNVFYSWGYAPLSSNPRHPVNYQPHWYVKDEKGRSILEYSVDELKNLGIEGYYLAPSNKQVQAYLIQIAEEIVTHYEFDGIHFDYIRYPGSDFVYDQFLRSDFMRYYCVDPEDLLDTERSKIRYSEWGFEDLQTKWHTYINTSLTQFISILRSRLKTHRPDILISAAVKSNYTNARYEHYQDWRTWLNSGSVDFVCLMSYTSNISYVLKKVEKAVVDPRRVVVGIGVYMLTPDQVAVQVEEVRSSPFAGVAFFSYDRIKENQGYLNALR
jgi:uncharacterized lipoprotein YddW (UPF0748 family)